MGGLIHRVGDGFGTGVAALAGVWLVLKDWHDLLPAHRDTTAWRLGLHVRFHPFGRFAEPIRCPNWPRWPPGSRPGEPRVGLTPNIAWRTISFLHVEPFRRSSSRTSGRSGVALLLVDGSVPLAASPERAAAGAHPAHRLSVLDLLKDWTSRPPRAAPPRPRCSGWAALLLRPPRSRYASGGASPRPVLAGTSLLPLRPRAVWIAAPESASFVTILRETGTRSFAARATVLPRRSWDALGRQSASRAC